MTTFCEADAAEIAECAPTAFNWPSNLMDWELEQ